VSRRAPRPALPVSARLHSRRRLDEQGLSFEPVEARFVRIRILSKPWQRQLRPAGWIEDHEAQRPGYTSLLTRNPTLAAWVSVTIPPCRQLQSVHGKLSERR